MNFSPEVGLLRLFARQVDVLKASEGILDEINLDTEIAMVLDAISSYYKTYDHHAFISKDELVTYTMSKFGTYKGIDVLIDIINTMYIAEVSDSLCSQMRTHLIEKHLATQISEGITKILGGTEFGIIPQLQEHIDAYHQFCSKEIEEVEDDLETGGLIEIQQELYDDNGLRWRSPQLQASLGNLTGGILLHIAARPEVGKTAFLCCETTHWAAQLPEDQCILWLNNEEGSLRIKERILCSYFDQSKEQLMQVPSQEVMDKYNKSIGKKLRLLADKNAVSTIQEIHEKIKKHNPKILILDHADKYHYKGSQHLDQPVRLRELFRQYRAMAKKYNCAIIAVGHASTEAEGKKWIEMDHLDYSRTGKAAECDVVLGIGKTTKDDEQNLRYIHLPKNKLTGLHSKLVMNFDAKRSRYYDS